MDGNITKFQQTEHQRIINSFNFEINRIYESMENTLRDYGFWEDMYRAVLSKDVTWLESNYISWIPQNFGFDYAAVLDLNKNLVGQNIAKDTIYQAILNIDFPKSSDSHIEIVKLDKAYIIGITRAHSEVIDDYAGYLVTARQWDHAFVETQFNLSDNKVNFLLGDNLVIEDDNLLKIIRQTKDISLNQRTILEDDKYDYILLPVLDSQGQYIMSAVLKDDNSLIYGIKDSMDKSYRLSYGIGLGLIVISSLLMARGVSIPLRKLKDNIETISRTKRPLPIKISSRDELGVLINAFNKMAGELDEYNRSLQELSITDEVTGVFNYSYLYRFLDETIESSNKRITLAFIDVMFYKYYSQLYSREKADHILKVIGDEIFEFVEMNDLVARIDTTTLAVCFIDKDPDFEIDTIKKIKDMVEHIDFEGKEKLPQSLTTIGAGISSYPDNCSTKEELIQRADEELYKAKNFLNSKIGVYYPIFHSISNQGDEMELKDISIIARTALAIINSMDNYTLSHSEGVTKYSMIIGQHMGLGDANLEKLKYGAMLHDIGKIELGSEILNKSAKLTDEEFIRIKKHPVYGENMLKPLSKLKDILPIIRNHHERYDGKGYPDGLKGDEIPLLARIVAVADSFDAMTTVRPYKVNIMEFQSAKDELVRCSGSQFDPSVVNVFAKIIDQL